MTKKIKVLVIGDIMIDKYTYVTTNRIASEAPIPVWDEIRSEYRLGGAANVAHNISAIGKHEVDVRLAGIVGNIKYRKMLRAAGVNVDLCVGSSTMTKHRYVDEKTLKIISRFDNKRKFEENDLMIFEAMMESYLIDRDFDVIVISDYDKGTITERIVELLRKYKLTVVDSKRYDLSIFSGMNVLKINENEYSAQVSNKKYINFERLFNYCIITKGKDGAQIRQHEFDRNDNEKYIVHTETFPVESAEVVDVTGCGDTHTAAVAFIMAKTGDIRSAVRFANVCAKAVVHQFGTSTPQLSNSFTS